LNNRKQPNQPCINIHLTTTKSQFQPSKPANRIHKPKIAKTRTTIPVPSHTSQTPNQTCNLQKHIQQSIEHYATAVGITASTHRRRRCTSLPCHIAGAAETET
jgi:hypothetical protein